MGIFTAVIGAIIAFFLVVLVHELGHFYVARLLHVRVLKFSIGFGKAIWSYTAKSGVKYVIGILPLGGYVKMLDAWAEKDATLSLSGSTGEAFHKKSLLTRFAVVLAGPLANLLLAVCVFWLVYVLGVTSVKPVVGHVAPQSIAARADLKPGDEIVQIGSWKTRNWQHVFMALITNLGENRTLSWRVLPKHSAVPMAKYVNLQHLRLDTRKPDLLRSFGITPYMPAIPAIVSKILPNTPAAHSKLQPGDKIVSMNGKKIQSWQSLVALIQQHPGKRIRLGVRRQRTFMDIDVTVVQRQLQGKTVGFLGVQPKIPEYPATLQTKIQYSVLSAWLPAIEQTWRLVSFHFVVLKQMILGRISLQTLGGPITIFQTAGSASLAGFKVYLQFLALISVVLGVINLLPIPALDGGHLLFYVVEGVARRPLPLHVQILLTNLGIAFLVLLMLYASFNDLLRLLM